LFLSQVVYKKLKGLKSTLADLADLQPDLAKGLQSLLDFDGDVQAAFGFTFQISYEVFGEIRTIDLKRDGGDLPVTNENRDEYVTLYVQYVLDVSVAAQFAAFLKGFHRVCGGDALDLFTAPELELLLCGNPVLNFQDLEKGANYEDGYTASSTAIRNFWQICHEFSEEEKRMFLKFVSGSDRSPIDGLSKLKFVISKNGSDDQRLPSAHTCFNHLLLPDYSSIDVMREKIKYAMTQSEGFGLR
jgi:ubiquitin-protein ligase E3 A